MQSLRMKVILICMDVFVNHFHSQHQIYMFLVSIQGIGIANLSVRLDKQRRAYDQTKNELSALNLKVLPIY